MINVNLHQKKELTPHAELRYDILRDEWVIVSNKREKRPNDFVDEEEKIEYNPETDLFADPEKTDQEEDVLIYRDEKDEWTTRVFPNKYPAVAAGAKEKDCSQGPYRSMVAFGNHEVVVTRDGRKKFADLEQNELAEVIDAYRERYVALMNQRGISSISIFHNHGKKAGASIVHPHSQIIALPVVTPAVMQEMKVCEQYAQSHKEHLFEVMAEYELERGERVVYTNDKFIVFCPFASSRAFQMRILPREAQPYFERISPDGELFLADALSHALQALDKTLDDPDFNYYIRTAPCDGQAYDAYSYHVDVFPRTHTYAGFEFATDIEIVPMSPEKAAAYLRESIEG